MSRFTANAPAARRKLYVDAIAAHRDRNSQFVTFEVDADQLATAGADGPEPDLGIPWIQFGDGTVNLDCTDDELAAVKSLLTEFPAFKIDDIHRPEDADGVNVRISAKADPNRIGQFVDATFQQVYELPEEFQVWVVDI